MERGRPRPLQPSIAASSDFQNARPEILSEIRNHQIGERAADEDFRAPLSPLLLARDYVFSNAMNAEHPIPESPVRPLRRRIFRGCAFGCLGGLLLLIVGVAFLVVVLKRVPKTYPPAERPIPASAFSAGRGSGLDGFDSPYLGHTGSWDGKGGGMGGSSKVPDLDKERAMGLRWTFMAVYWKALELKEPADLRTNIPPAWQELDAFVIAAHDRGLNILMQAPVMGGNAGGPPGWAGRREPGRSAPVQMDAAAEFAARLAQRYRPGGTLALREGWGERCGVRAWELDNEPEGYLTHWKDQAADYAEFVTKVSRKIKEVDARALILAPGIGSSESGRVWLEGALDAKRLAGSPEFRKQAVPYSLGPATDAVSFHIYEGLDTAFAGHDRTLERAFSEIRAVFEKWEQGAPGFEYARKHDYWHTEGNFDFFGLMSAERRAAWRIQFLTRGFAAGIRKLMIMDASEPEQVAVRTYIRLLPNPFPIEADSNAVKTMHGQGVAYRHSDGTNTQSGRVWVAWARADTGDATLEIPTVRPQIEVYSLDGKKEVMKPTDGRLRIDLKGDAKMPPPLLIVDRP